MAIAAEDQLAMDETVIEDEVVEHALEHRQKCYEATVEPRKAFKAAKEATSVALQRLELPTGSVARVGRFRIERVEVPSKHVAFDTDPTTQLKIKLVDDSTEDAE